MKTPPPTAIHSLASTENIVPMVYKHSQDPSKSSIMPQASNFWRGVHRYTVIFPVCKAGENTCTKAGVFAAMRKHMKNQTPNNETSPVVDGGTAPIIVGGIPFGEVTTNINEENYSITNTTTEDHLLHPGTVTRSVKEVDGDIIIETHGTGEGIFPWLNESLAGPVWYRTNQNVLETMEELQSTPKKE